MEYLQKNIEKFILVDDISFFVRFDYQHGCPAILHLEPENCHEGESDVVDILELTFTKCEHSLTEICSQEFMDKVTEEIKRVMK